MTGLGAAGALRAGTDADLWLRNLAIGWSPGCAGFGSPVVATALGIPGSAFCDHDASLAWDADLELAGRHRSGLTVGLPARQCALSLIVLPLAMHVDLWRRCNG